MCGVWFILLPLPITGSLHTKLVAICGFRLFIRKLYKYFTLRIPSAGSPFIESWKYWRTSESCVTRCAWIRWQQGGCRRKSHEKGAANDVAACSILCVAYCPYLYSKYRFCAANVLYVHSSNDCLCRFLLHPLSISAHHAGGGRAGTLFAFTVEYVLWRFTCLWEKTDAFISCLRGFRSLRLF